MPSRLYDAPEFGQYLKSLWRPKGWGLSHENVAIKLRSALPEDFKISRSNVLRFEQGRIPDWRVLAAISQAYDVPMMELVRQLVKSLQLVTKSGERVDIFSLRQSPSDAEQGGTPISGDLGGGTEPAQRGDAAENDRTGHRHALEQDSQQPGESNDKASATIRALENRLQEYERLIGDLETIASRLFRTALGRDEAADALRRKTKRRASA